MEKEIKELITKLKDKNSQVSTMINEISPNSAASVHTGLIVEYNTTLDIIKQLEKIVK